MVLGNLQHRLEADRKLNQIMSLIGSGDGMSQDRKDPIVSVKNVFMDLGILSEKSTKDMVAIIEDMMFNSSRDWSYSFEYYCSKNDESKKVVRQRIRRAVSKALRNLSYLGLEDNLSATFVRYAHTLFDFETVKREMDYLRGNKIQKGTVSIERFVDNVVNGQWDRG